MFSCVRVSLKMLAAFQEIQCQPRASLKEKTISSFNSKYISEVYLAAAHGERGNYSASKSKKTTEKYVIRCHLLASKP